MKKYNNIKISSFFIILFLGFTWLLNGESDAKIYKCRIDTSIIKSEVNRGIFGTNLEWFNNANGIWNPSENAVDPAFIELARDQGLSLVRFPGGTFSDFYHWEDGTGSLALRKVTPHFTDPGSSRNLFGSPELIKFCKLLGAKPLITVNAGTGTAEEAARWVSYMNAPADEKRITDGIYEPIGVEFWEIGNELYLNGSDAEKKIGMSPENYVEKFLAYSDKMRSIDPSISLIAIGVAGSYNIPFSQHSDWNRILLSQAGNKIDYVSLHNSYFPVLYKKNTYDTQKIYQSLWGAVSSVEKDINEVSSLINVYCKNSKPGIAITEWGPFFSINDPNWIDHVKTMGSAIYVARMFQLFISNPVVKIANYFKFTDNSFMGWISYTKVPKILYYVVNLYSNHFGKNVVESHIETPYFKTEKIGFVKPVARVPILSVISSLNNSGDRLFINIVSCSMNEEYMVLLDILNAPVSMDLKNGVMRIIRASSPLAHNGKDIPDWWPIKVVEPSVNEGHTEIKTVSLDCSIPIKIPPLSILVIEVGKKY